MCEWPCALCVASSRWMFEAAAQLQSRLTDHPQYRLGVASPSDPLPHASQRMPFTCGVAREWARVSLVAPALRQSTANSYGRPHVSDEWPLGCPVEPVSECRRKVPSTVRIRSSRLSPTATSRRPQHSASSPSIARSASFSTRAASTRSNGTCADQRELLENSQNFCRRSVLTRLLLQHLVNPVTSVVRSSTCFSLHCPSLQARTRHADLLAHPD